MLEDKTKLKNKIFVWNKKIVLRSEYCFLARCDVIQNNCYDRDHYFYGASEISSWRVPSS